jgi:hypothetical protein
MDVIQYPDAKEFLIRATPYLARHESLNNLMLGLALRLSSSPLPFPEALFYETQRNGESAGFAMRTNANRPLSLSTMETESVVALAQFTSSLKLDSAIASKENVEIFLNERRRLTGEEIELVMAQGIYELTQVIFPPAVPGHMHIARNDELSKVLEFSIAFAREAVPNEPLHLDQLTESCTRLVQQGHMRFWMGEDGSYQAMAARNREGIKGATISFVYTPPELRGRGIASQLVAALAQDILDSGKSLVNLFTDLTNPTSNSIYQKIGFYCVGEGAHYKFIAESASRSHARDQL